jgi:hypothetical protein
VNAVCDRRKQRLTRSDVNDRRKGQRYVRPVRE